MSDQDWKPVILRKRKPTVDKTSIGVPAGKPKITIDKDGNEIVDIKKVSKATAQFIIQSRNEKNIKQADLAKQCNLDVKIINDIEKGGCVYNFEHINKISKVLGKKIPRD